MQKGKRRLTPKQHAFALEFVKDHHPGDALVRAGYATEGRYAANIASRLLKREDIQAVIARQETALRRAATVTPARLIEELAAIALSNVKDFSAWDGEALTLTSSDKIPRRISRAISEIVCDIKPDGSSKVRLKLHSKGEALRQISEILGLPKSRLVIEDPQGKNPLTSVLQDIWKQIEEGKNPGSASRSEEHPAALPPGDPLPVPVSLEGTEEHPLSKVLEGVIVTHASLKPSDFIHEVEGCENGP